MDDGRIAFTPAVELSYLNEQEQYDLLEQMELNDCTPSLSQACRFKKMSGEEGLTLEVIATVMSEEKANQREMFKVPMERIRKYVPNANTKQAEDFVMKACEHYRRYLIRQRDQCGPAYRPITSEILNYDEVIEKYDKMMDWLAGLYVNTLNLIQYMHDKYFYEAAEMALIDTEVRRTFATGIAGFSHVVDSLSAIKYATVKTVRDETGIVVDYVTEGDFPRYGNDDDRADEIAIWLLRTFLDKIKKHHTYRNSEPTTSILTITSNVVYGKATGSMPDGRKAGEPLSPGANPSYGAEKSGLLASLNSVAKLPYHWALDGISNTQTINPDALGHSDDERVVNLVQVMDGYFDQGAHHLNVNVFGKEKLIDAMEHPEKEEYANFTIRVSGYAVKFIDLTREQQLDVISRTCHATM